MRARNPTLDVLKAAMLTLACFNHVCAVALFPSGTCQIFYNPLGFFTGAEGFVFLSGILAAQGGAMDVRRWGKRLAKLFGAQLLLCLFVGQLQGSFSFRSLLGAPFLDVLPLYIVLTALTPALHWAFMRGRGAWAIGASALLWAACQFGTPRPAVDFYFNPLAWQFLFTLGFAANHWRPQARWALVPAILFLLCRQLNWLPYFDLGRENLAPWGLANFLVVALAAYSFLKDWRPVAPVLAVVGRNSLWIFVFNTALRFVLQAWQPTIYYGRKAIWVGGLRGLAFLAAHLAVAYAADGRRERWGFRRWLLVALAVLPVLYVPGFGRAFRDARWLAVWCLGIAAAAALWRERRSLPVPRWAIVPVFFLVWQAVTIGVAGNFGLAWQVLALDGALALIAWQLWREPLSPESLRRALLLPVLLALVLIEARVYLGWSLVPEGSGLGALVGERNSASAFLALAFPLIFVAHRRGWWWVSTAILHALIALRTRAVWWMLIFYAGAFLLSGRGRRFAVQLALAIALVLTLPSTLHWSSPHPYRDSVQTLASPHDGNGRVALWRVGWKMFAEHPLLGIGAGNYPAAARAAIASSGEDPSKFAFLRPDLPLFQDYLEVFVDNGAIGGLLFALFAGLAPWLLLLAARRASIEVGALALGAAALTLDACLDSPLHRPETLFLFVVYLVTVASVLPAKTWRMPRAATGIGFALLAAFLSLTAIRFGGSQVLRHREDRLALAWQWWPWDGEWSETEFTRLLHFGDEATAQALRDGRERFWPQDPTNPLIRALWEDRQGNEQGAQSLLKLASVQLPNGRPVPDAFDRFENSRLQRQPASAATVRVLLYHHFTQTGSGDQYTMPVATFEAQMQALQDGGYRSLSTAEYRRVLQGEAPAPEHGVVLTFDDWSPGQFELARPVLERHGFHGVFFVITDRVQNPEEQTKLRALLDAGHEIGSHTEHHYFLAQSPCDQDWKCCHENRPCTRRQIHAEIFQSKRFLDSILGEGRTITAFAWPGGFSDEKLTKEAQRAGYQTIFAVEEQAEADGVPTNLAGTSHSPDHIFRTEIDGRCPLSAFRQAVRDGRCCVLSSRKFYRYCLPQTP